MLHWDHEVVIVGAGPAGLSAAAHASEGGLDAVVLERCPHLADTIHCYQRRKPVMAEPSQIPLRSDLPFAAGSREEVLDGWEGYVDRHGLKVRTGCEVTGLERLDGSEGSEGPGGFRVRAGGEELRCRWVVLALGTQGTPRRLGVPGDDLPWVDSRLVDPADHVDQDILVVGAGDSALEVVLALSDENRVTLVVRGEEIVRAKESLEREVLRRQADGALEILFRTRIRRLEPGFAELEGPQDSLRLPADRVFPKIGTLPPRRLLESFGVEFSGPEREARPRLSHVYESSVPGLYIIGAAGGRDLIKLGMNQGWEVVEHLQGREVLPADEEILAARLPFWSGTVRQRISELRRQVPLFGEVDGEVLREALLSAEAHAVGAGEVILRQNDYTDSFLVILDGEVSISAFSAAGGETGDGNGLHVSDGERHVAVLGAGDFLGEMSLLSGRRRNATATARSDALLLEIQRKAMLNLLLNSPAAEQRLDAAFLARALQSYLFPDLEGHEVQELAASCALRRLDKDEVLFREGDPGDAYYLIRRGKVKISIDSSGRERVLRYLDAGNGFGEAALLPDEPRSATVTAIFPSDLIELSRQALDDFLATRPQLRRGLLESLESRRAAALLAEATPGASEVLGELISGEVVMGTDVLIIDDHKCVRCNNCLHACEGVHDDGQSRLSLTGIKLYHLLAPNSCWQCEDPLCMLDCPPDALVRDPRGEVYIKSNCIGCGNCETNCPYGNIFMVHPRRRRTAWEFVQEIFGGEPEGTLELEKEIAVKCDLCRDIAGGPACVRSCPTGAAIRVGSEEYQRLSEELLLQGAVRDGGG